ARLTARSRDRCRRGSLAFAIDNGRQGSDESRLRVRQRDPVHGDAGGGRLLPGGDVDVIEDLEMISEKLQRYDEDLGDPTGAKTGEEVLHVRGQPFLRRVPGALVREARAIVIETQPRRDCGGGVAQLRDVAGIAFDDRAGKAVGSEDDGDAVTDISIE